MKRLGALLAAVALVGVALFARDRFDSGAGSGDDAVGRLTCSTELSDACAALADAHEGVEVTVEPAGRTATRLAEPAESGDFGLDAWLVAQPYAELAIAEAAAAGIANPLTDAGLPVAHSRLGFYVHSARADAFRAHCGAEPTWPCVFSASVQPNWGAIGGGDPLWGPFKPYVSDPDEAGGLLALGGSAVGVLGPDGVDALTIREDPFAGNLAALARAHRQPSGRASVVLGRMLAGGPAEVDLVVALQADGTRFKGAAAAKASLLYPSPVVSAQVVALGIRNSEAADGLLQLLRGEAGQEALRAAGWSQGPASPANSNSPSIGAHITLRDLWRELT